MKRLLTSKKILPLIIFGALITATLLVMINPPTSEQRPPPPPAPIAVETMTVATGRYDAAISSYGTVQPRIQSMVVSQVNGMITEVSPQFRAGGFFKAGDILLQIDDRDYRADVSIAEANLLDAKQQLAEEEALSAQAASDWKRLGNEGEAPELVLRKPQLMAAQATLKSAEATLEKARLDLERTGIRAAFDGRVLETLVDLGQVVSANSSVAEIYAADYVEVRLPICNCDLEMVTLPEGDPEGNVNALPVTLYSSLEEGRQWLGRVTRTEAAIDDASRQLHVVAQIDDPFQGGSPVKIGEYVTAIIQGKSLPDALVIPVTSIYQGSHVYVVENGVLERREVTVRWQNSEDAIIEDGLSAGDQLVVTPLGQVTSGTRVTVLGDPAAAERTPAP